MKTIWLLETRNAPPVAYANYVDGERAFIEACRGDSLEEIVKDADEWGFGFEFQEGQYLYVDDGPHLYRIDYYE